MPPFPEPSTRPRSLHLGRIPVVGPSALNRIAASAHSAGGVRDARPAGGMLSTGLVFVLVIVLGETSRALRHRDRRS